MSTNSEMTANPFKEPSAATMASDALTLLELLPNAVLCMDAEFRFTYANAAARRLSRLPQSALNGPTHWELFPETAGTAIETIYREVLASGVPRHLEHFYEPFSLWVDLSIQRYENGLLLYYEDITERKRAEEQRDNANNQIRQGFEATPDGVVTIDRNWIFTYANHRALELVSKDSIVGHNIFELFPGNDLPPFGTSYRTTMAERIPTEFEAFHPEPLNLWLKVRARPYDGGIVVFFSDISERKQAELREQETARRLSELLEATSDAVASLDRDWRYTFLNGRARQLIDPNNRLIGKQIWEEFPAAINGLAWESYHRSMDEGVPAYTELYYSEPINAWLALHSFPTPDGIVVFFRDITEQKTHDQIVREQQELLSMVQHNARLATWKIDLLTRRVTFGNASYAVFGHPLKSLEDLDSFLRIITPGHLARIRSTIVPILAQDHSFNLEYEVTGADGSTLWIESRGNASFRDGRPVHVAGISLDNTERKRNEESLAKSEELYRVLADLNPQAIWAANPDGAITYANQGFLDYIGHTIAGLAGLGWLKSFHPDHRDHVVEVWTKSVTTGVDYELEALICRASDQTYRWWNLRALPVRDEEGTITSWLGVGQDIHDSKTAAEALRAEQQETERKRLELETVYRTAPIGLSLIDPVEFRFLRINEREAEILGRPESEVIGKTIAEIAPIPGLLELFQQVAQGIPVMDHLIEGEVPLRPGDRRAWTVNYFPVYGPSGKIEAISTAAIDVTNQRRSEAALVQSEKLAAVGRLASSISHEINNPLEAVTNLLYLIALSADLSDENRVYIQMAQSELSRVSQIATQTLRFHRQAVAPTFVTAEDLVGAVLNLYQGRLANSGIRVDTRYVTDARILCFENDIRQVLNNLIANAIDAMRSGGRLVLRAHDACTPDGIPGVRITVADTGHGMSAETAARIFEPFFTTKDLNGTGLGLWISNGIVQRHQGRLIVRSSENPVRHGSVFALFLPLEQEKEISAR